MGPAGDQSGWGWTARASRGWRATSDSVRVRWSAPMSPLRRALLVVVGAMVMVALIVAGVLALGLIVVGALIAAAALGARRLWWAIIRRPSGGPDEGQNELRRNVRVRGE